MALVTVCDLRGWDRAAKAQLIAALRQEAWKCLQDAETAPTKGKLKRKLAVRALVLALAADAFVAGEHGRHPARAAELGRCQGRSLLDSAETCLALMKGPSRRNSGAASLESHAGAGEEEGRAASRAAVAERQCARRIRDRLFEDSSHAQRPEARLRILPPGRAGYGASSLL